MNNDTARLVRSVLVRSVCDDLGLEVRSYSGRAMYGTKCIGVTCDNPFQAFAQIVVALCEKGEEGVEAADHFTRDGAVKTDSMGLGSILYFPRLPWVEEEEGEDSNWDDEACESCTEPR